MAEVAALMEITAEPGRRPRLVPAEGHEGMVQSLRASSVGPRLSEIVHRAKSVSQSRRRAVTKAQAQREEANAQTRNAQTCIEKGVVA